MLSRLVSRLSEKCSRWLRARSLTDALVAIALVATLIALYGPDSATYARWEIEKRIRDWKPSAADAAAPDPQHLVAEFDLTGQWSVHRHFNSSSLDFEKLPTGEYQVRFKTGGCFGQFETERRATFRDGVLALDRPVSEYMPATYEQLYAVRVADEIYLLPAAFVSRVRESDGDSIEDVSLERWAYCRGVPKTTTKNSIPQSTP